jgi:hypothetical protein
MFRVLDFFSRKKLEFGTNNLKKIAVMQNFTPKEKGWVTPAVLLDLDQECDKA